jgi:hypothetical protein
MHASSDKTKHASAADEDVARWLRAETHTARPSARMMGCTMSWCVQHKRRAESDIACWFLLPQSARKQKICIVLARNSWLRTADEPLHNDHRAPTQLVTIEFVLASRARDDNFSTPFACKIMAATK